MKLKTPHLLIGLGIIVLLLAFILPNLGGSKYLRSAKAGGDYLVSHMYDDGSFVYEYDPVTGDESSSYNILRHAGTAYSLIDLYEATKDERYLRAAEQALVYLNDQIVPCPERALRVEGPAQEISCVKEGDEIKLGGNGLAVLAFAEHALVTGSTEYLPQAQALAQFMVATQNPDGEFSIHKMNSVGTVDDFTSGYYPGEAIFALARLHDVDGNDVWIDTAHKAAHWLIEVRDADVATPDLNHDHWLLYGLNELYTNRADAEYLAHAHRIVESITAIQHHNKTGDEVDWNGGFYNPPRSTPTATRSEGLGAAYELFMQAGEEESATNAKDIMKKALEFQLRTQFTKRQLASLDADPTAVGAFHESLDEYEVRIDYVQHNISSLLAFVRMSE